MYLVAWQVVFLPQAKPRPQSVTVRIDTSGQTDYNEVTQNLAVGYKNV